MTSFEFRFEPDASKVRFLRSDIRERLHGLGVVEGDICRVVLVVDEIVSNSIEHAAGFRDHDDVLQVGLTVSDCEVRIEFHDPAVPATAVAEITRLLEGYRSGSPPADSERGRGLFLINDGLDDLVVERGAGGVGMTLRGRLLRETP